MHSFFANHPGFGLLSRIAAAVVGGYLLSSAWVVLCGALSTETHRAGAVMAGVQTSFVIEVVAVIWAFSPVSLSRIWAGIVIPAALMAGAAALLAGGRG